MFLFIIPELNLGFTRSCHSDRSDPAAIAEEGTKWKNPFNIVYCIFVIPNPDRVRNPFNVIIETYIIEAISHGVYADEDQCYRSVSK